MSEKFASREVMNLVICDYKTNKPLLNLDYANTTSAELSGDSVHAHGGWGYPKRIAFNGEKEGTFTIETQIRTMELYSLVTGASISSTARFIQREEITAVAGVLTTSKTPVVGSINVFAANDDCGTAKNITATGSSIDLGDATDTNTYIVYYLADVTGVTKLNIKSTVFPRDVKMYGDTLMKTESGDMVPYKMLVYKATPETDLNLEFTNNGDPASLTLTFTLQADGDNNMLDLIIDQDANLPTYAVIFDANTGTGTMDALTAEEGVATNLTANEFTKNGYTFKNWNTRADGTGTSYPDGASVALEHDITLYAQWQAE